MKPCQGASSSFCGERSWKESGGDSYAQYCPTTCEAHLIEQSNSARSCDRSAALHQFRRTVLDDSFGMTLRQCFLTASGTECILHNCFLVLSSTVCGVGRQGQSIISKGREGRARLHQTGIHQTDAGLRVPSSATEDLKTSVEERFHDPFLTWLSSCRRFRPWRSPLTAVKRASDWVGRRVDRTRAFLCHHWHLLRTGESATELAIVFSPIVAASSLAYLGPAACFYATKKLAMTALFSMITFTSLQADSLQPSNKLWCMTDRTIATVAGELGVCFARFRSGVTRLVNLQLVLGEDMSEARFCVLKSRLVSLYRLQADSFVVLFT